MPSGQGPDVQAVVELLRGFSVLMKLANEYSKNSQYVLRQAQRNFGKLHVFIQAWYE